MNNEKVPTNVEQLLKLVDDGVMEDGLDKRCVMLVEGINKFLLKHAKDKLQREKIELLRFSGWDLARAIYNCTYSGDNAEFVSPVWTFICCNINGKNVNITMENDTEQDYTCDGRCNLMSTIYVKANDLLDIDATMVKVEQDFSHIVKLADEDDLVATKIKEAELLIQTYEQAIELMKTASVPYDELEYKLFLAKQEWARLSIK